MLFYNRKYFWRQAPIDLMSAFALLLFGGMISFNSLIKLRSHFGNTKMPLGHIASGEAVYDLRQGEQCIGRLTTSLLDDEVTIVQASGTVHVTDFGILKLSLILYVNPLNQMVSCELSVEALQAYMQAKVEGTDEVRVLLHWQRGNVKGTRSITFRGPILVEIGPERLLTLELPHNVLSPSLNGHLPRESLGMDLSIVKHSDGLCEGMDYATMDIQSVYPVMNILRYVLNDAG
jgi:hypothetical protein